MLLSSKELLLALYSLLNNILYSAYVTIWFFLKAHLTKQCLSGFIEQAGCLYLAFASQIIILILAWYVRDLTEKFKNNYSLAGEFKPDIVNCY